MNVADIDHDLDLLAAQALASGDESEAPGLILLSSDTWCRETFKLEHEITSIIDGIRYRQIQVLISSKYEDKVLTQAEAKPFKSGELRALGPKPDRA